MDGAIHFTIAHNNKRVIKIGIAKMEGYDNLKAILSFYGVNITEPYYISTVDSISSFPDGYFRMDFYTFCICINGSIEVEIDSKSFEISENGFLISAPSTIVRYIHRSTDFRMKILFFDKNFILKNIVNPFFMEHLGLFTGASFRVSILDQNQSEQFALLLDYLYKQKNRTDRFAKDIVRTIILNIVLEISAVIDNASCDNSEIIPSENHSLYYKFVQIVQDNVHHNRSVKYYADQLCVSNKYLITIIKHHTGKTPHQIIDEALLKVIYVLMGDPEKNVSQIAFDSGFSSVSSFGRFFKKYVNLTPQQFRKQIL